MKKLIVCMLAALMLCSACAQDGSEQGAVNEKSGAAVTKLSSVSAPKAVAFDDYEMRNAIRDENSVDADFIEALNAFTFKSADKLLSEGEEGKCCSPLSLYYALSIAATGASGKTQEQLLAALGVTSADELSKQCGNLYRSMYTDNEFGKLILANSVWVDGSFTVKQAFLDNAVKEFYAETFGVDFSSPETAQAMTKWVNDYTNGLLQPEFAPDPMQVMSIINTVYFADEWSDRFSDEATAEGEFTLANGEKVKCDFMNRTDMCRSFNRGDNYLAASLNTKNDRSMMFILPDEGVSVYDLLDADTLAAIVSAENNGYGELVYSIPKFDQSADMELADALKAMGITDAFDSEKADFSAMSDMDSFISSVIQQCRVKIDEKGVEAAAYTEIAICGAGMADGHAELILNRPFIYVVKDYATDTVLFIGVVADPTK